MKKIFYSILTTAFLVCSLSIFAGNNNDNNNDTQNSGMETFVQLHIDRLKADIELTEEQEEAIIELLEKLYTDREISAGKTTRKEQIAGKKKDYENYIAARDSILTEEQLAELERKAEERKNGINL
jgi:Spy/CpxP family protein refolding chaperone